MINLGAFSNLEHGFWKLLSKRLDRNFSLTMTQKIFSNVILIYWKTKLFSRRAGHRKKIDAALSNQEKNTAQISRNETIHTLTQKIMLQLLFAVKRLLLQFSIGLASGPFREFSKK